jgi:hypothetical protein
MATTGNRLQTPLSTLTAADGVRENLARVEDGIRNNPALSVDAMQSAMATAYLKAKADMLTLSNGSVEDVAAKTRILTAKVWGVDDIAGTNAVDRAAAAVSYRDAQDRASALANSSDAAHLMTTAERSGDELLARAVASKADAMRWDDVAGQYFGPRPAQAQALSELHQLTQSPPSIRDVFMYIVPTPSELAGLNDFRIQLIADDPRFTNLR